MDELRGEEHRVLLSLRGIHKRYGGVHALRGVDLDLAPGEVHALVGQNGAGKSTLIKVISGAEQPDAGQVLMDGRPLTISSPQRAFALGIATVYQEPHLLPELTVTENVFLGRELRDRLGNIDWRRQRQRVRELCQRLAIDPDLADAPMRDLGIALHQLVQIAKALANQARVLVLDEPSAILTQRETEILFHVVRQLRSEGVAVLYISHHLEEIFAIADRVTVMKDGEVVARGGVRDLSMERIIQLMVGRRLEAGEERRRRIGDRTVLEVRELGRAGRYRQVSFSVRAGEIVGLFGLIGAGGMDVMLALFGAEPAETGEIRLEGRKLAIRSPRDAAAHGIAMLPEDRKTQGLFLSQSLAYNVAMGNLGRMSRLGFVLAPGREASTARSWIDRLTIRAPGPGTRVEHLSGGNQQKVLLARLLTQRPRLLLLAEPTRGVDVGAKEEIHRLVFELADAGVPIVVVSSELPEVVRLADRVMVMRQGRLAAEYARETVDPAVVLNAAIGEEVGRAVV